MSSDATCSCAFPETDEVCSPILDAAGCYAAADALSVSYAATYNLTSNQYPGGCYFYKDYILYFNEFTNVTGRGCVR